MGEDVDYLDQNDRKISDFQKILLIPNGWNTENMLFFAFCYAVQYV